MLVGIGIFVPLRLGRASGSGCSRSLGGSLAFATLGVALGGLVRDVRAASLLALLVSFPLVFLALVPAGAVAVGLYDAIRVVSAIFPFKAALEAIDAAVNRSTPAVWIALAHLAALVAGFGAARPARAAPLVGLVGSPTRLGCFGGGGFGECPHSRTGRRRRTARAPATIGGDGLS